MATDKLGGMDCLEEPYEHQTDDSLAALCERQTGEIERLQNENKHHRGIIESYRISVERQAKESDTREKRIVELEALLHGFVVNETSYNLCRFCVDGRDGNPHRPMCLLRRVKAALAEGGSDVPEAKT